MVSRVYPILTIHPVKNDHLPHCSIVIPTRRRPATLHGCLAAIASSDYPHDRMETIIVDDGGYGGSALNETVAQMRGRLSVRVLRTAGLGPAGARNAGAKDAGGEVLAFTDDDCRVDPGWLRTLCCSIARSEETAAGGQTVNGLRNNRWSAASQHIIDLVYAYYNADPRRAAFLTTNNLAVRKRAFDELGGFDESYRTAEDREFCRRWLARGHQLVYVPEAIVSHEHELSAAEFFRQHFGYGRGAFQFLRAASGREQIRMVRGFYASIPRLISALRDSNGDGSGRKRRTTRIAELAMWQAANISGFAWEAARTAGRSVFAMF